MRVGESEWEWMGVGGNGLKWISRISIIRCFCDRPQDDQGIIYL